MTTQNHQHTFTHHLLVIDDHDDKTGQLKTLLESSGFRVTRLESSNTASDSTRHLHFDLILLNLTKPLSNSQEAMKFLQEKRQGIPLIVISMDYAFPTLSSPLKQGTFDFVRRPYSTDELLNAIRNALEKSRLQHEYNTMQQRIQQSEKMHRFMVNNSPDIIYILNERGHFTFINDSVERVLNIPKDQLLGQHFSALVGDDENRQRPFVFNERRAAGRKPQNCEMQLRRRLSLNGNSKSATLSVPFEINAMGIYEVDKVGGKRQFRGTYGIARDITDRKQAESFMRFQAYHDLLTGLPNRSLFRDRLSLAISHAKRNNSKVGVMFLDIDRFKAVNDSLGHPVGDLLIQAIARRISGCLREGDTLSRFGGDEFTLLLPNIGSQNDAAIIARKITTELKEAFYIEQHEIFISGSIGIAIYPENGDQIDALIQNADIAMYHIKSNGKNGYQFFSAQMNQEFSERVALEKDLRVCLEQNQLALEYQPIYNVDTGAVYALEAFLRWNHPQRGVILPPEFLKIAEEIGLLVDIGAWVVDQACSDLASWQNPVLRIAINFSPLQVEHPDFENLLMRAMQQHNISPNQIEIEITEQLLNRNQAAITAKLKRLTRLGFSIAVDNFGTGLLSLSYLHQLPIHTIKMDQSFLRHISDDRNSGDACIVSAIAAMATGLNLNLVAEGVETTAQKHYLSQLGCSTMQGYLFQKPVNRHDARNITVAPLLLPE